MSHTKGPWVAKEQENLNEERSFWIFFDEFSSIAEVRHGAWDEEYGGEKALVANAHLIAAAPEMLAALELILNDNRLMNAMSKDQARAILDSIKKARGVK